jgi:8-oxo-dGTP diphosphatase
VAHTLGPVTVRTCLCLITRPSQAGARLAGPGTRSGGSRRAGPDGDQAGTDREVLLGFKKTGFGAGRWVGLGGHIEDGEQPAEAAAREVQEESGLIVAASTLRHLADLTFVFPARPAWDQTADVYVTADFDGEPAESDELVPRWFPIDALPFDGMWDDARYWLPVVLAGHRVIAEITFADDCATVAAIQPALSPAGATVSE